MITDSYGRTINYLRLAVTDRCNLRCTYCMPKEGLGWIPRKELMTYEEIPFNGGSHNLITNVILKKPKDGWEAQNILVAQHREHESMATIGG